VQEGEIPQQIGNSYANDKKIFKGVIQNLVRNIYSELVTLANKI